MCKKISNLCYILLILFALSFIIACGTTNPDVTKEKKEWTFLFYDDADFDHAYDPIENFSEHMKSGDNLNVIILQDKESDPARILYLDENHELSTLVEKGEVDMGAKTTLKEFINYAKKEFPAERYIISFYNHGGGWMGACIDKSHNGFLTMDKMKQALLESNGVDIVMFSAPCLMGAIESVYELRSCTDIYIGSENVSGYCYWHETMAVLSDELISNPSITNNELGEFIVNSIWEINNSSTGCSNSIDKITMSAISTSKISELVNALDVLCLELLNDIGDTKNRLNAGKDNYEIMYKTYLDLYSILEVLSSTNPQYDMMNMINEVKGLLSEVVVAQCMGENWRYAKGLNIYFPYATESQYSSFYESISYGLDFAQDSNWDELLNTLIGNKPTQLNSGPPSLVYSMELNHIE